MQQIVRPIKDSNILKNVQETLIDSFRAGRRNYTIFQLGKATLLRVSDVMQLKKADVFKSDGSIKQNAFIHDKRTGKANTLYLKPVQADLLDVIDKNDMILNYTLNNLKSPNYLGLLLLKSN